MTEQRKITFTDEKLFNGWFEDYPEVPDKDDEEAQRGWDAEVDRIDDHYLARGLFALGKMMANFDPDQRFKLAQAAAILGPDPSEVAAGDAAADRDDALAAFLRGALKGLEAYATSALKTSAVTVSASVPIDLNELKKVAGEIGVEQVEIMLRHLGVERAFGKEKFATLITWLQPPAAKDDDAEE